MNVRKTLASLALSGALALGISGCEKKLESYHSPEVFLGLGVDSIVYPHEKIDIGHGKKILS